MEPLPTWLSAAIDAAGMTAYAEDIPRLLKKVAAAAPAGPAPIATVDEGLPPIH